MAQALRNLKDISTGYSVFEKDQVLTEEQLNSLARYLDDQERLTRVSLVGVGISCGLRVSLQSDKVTVTRGVGVTTDGDLLRMADDTVYSHYTAYGPSAPTYEPFGTGDARLTLFELLPQGASAAGAVHPLSEFASRTQRTLGNMVAVLLMESHEEDKDVCSGTDCDNLGKRAVHRPRLLLIDKGGVSRLKESLSTPDLAARSLPELVADRPSFTAASSLSALAGVYRTTCDSIHQKLAAALPQVYPACSGFIADLFSGDPTAGWLSRLTTLRTSFASTAVGIQYYYDFLKDVVETYNAFRERLFGETSVCCPDVGAFPKHLLLGGLTGGGAGERTGYYPSPATSPTSEQLRHARFLVSKLHALIHTFRVPTGSTLPVRITPSLFEDRPLEERAIPYYYEVNGTLPIHKHWSHARSLRGAEATHYSYSASSYGAQGAAANPLTAQLGGFPFFRIEGHLGANVDTVLAALEAEIRARNLPFTVRSIMLDTDRTKLPRRRKRYTDLHRMHYLVRQELAHQMDDVITFSNSFTQQVIAAVDAGRVRNQPEDTQGTPALPVKETATQKGGTVKGKASGAKAKLTLGYNEYKQGRTALQADLRDAMQAAGEFKYELGSAVKTEFATPFDAYIGNTRHWWLDWLDDLILDWENGEDDRLLLNTFLTEHPGLEHFAGVARGGTFVLVHDSANTVVADFMLAYHCPEPPEQEVEEKPRPRPGSTPPWIVDHGVRVLPPVEKFVTEKLEIFRGVFEPQVKNLIKPLEDRFLGFKESFESIGNVVLRPTLPQLPQLPSTFTEINMLEMQLEAQKVDLLRDRLLEPNLDPAVRTQYQTDLASAQQKLGATVTETAKSIANAGTDISVGSLEYKALTMATQTMTKLDASTLKTVKSGLSSVNTTGKTQLTSVLANMKSLTGR